MVGEAKRLTCLLMFVHRLRRWPRIRSTLGQQRRSGVHIVADTATTPPPPSKQEAFNQCWFHVEPPSSTLAQRETNIN